MTKELSVKITIVSFILLLGVVLAHATNLVYETPNKDIVWFIQQLYLDKLSNVIVTTFFFISGFLFFLSFKNCEKVHLNQFKDKIQKRFHTLVIPYLIWCSFWFVVLYILQFIPFLKAGFSLPLHEMSLFQQFYNLYLEPINYPFWFLRELILYVLISPLLYMIIKYLKYYFLIFLFIMALFSTSFFNVFGVSIFKYLMLFFFLLGGYVALFSVTLTFKVKARSVYLLFFLWIVLESLLLYSEITFLEKNWVTKLMTNALILLGCFSCWTLYDVLNEKFKFEYKKIYTYGFFIYAVHGLPILFLKKAVLPLANFSRFELLLLYIFLFGIIAILSIGIGAVCKKYLSKFYYISTGNR